VFHALKDAVASLSADGVVPRFDAPATPERVLMAVTAARARVAKASRKAAE
jgi:xanthine dehydrogenase large subunit